MKACKALREFLVICLLLGPLAAAAASQNASGRCPFPSEAAGKVRKMTAVDMERWLQFLRACWGPLDTPPVANPGPSRPPSAPPNAYVVVEPFVVPTGLFGAHAVTFHVFKGDKPPVVRDQGHSILHDANKYRCK